MHRLGQRPVSNCLETRSFEQSTPSGTGSATSFRDWAAECTDAPREVCELALAHVNQDRVEAAYRRSDLFEKRRMLMADWANYIAAARG